MVLTCEGVIKSSKSVNWRAPLKPAAILFLFVLPLAEMNIAGSHTGPVSLQSPIITRLLFRFTSATQQKLNVIFVAKENELHAPDQRLLFHLFLNHSFPPGYMIDLTRRERERFHSFHTPARLFKTSKHISKVQD